MTTNDRLGFAFIVLVAAGAAHATPQEDADTLMRAREWTAAETAYDALLAADPANPANWQSLGQARQEAGDPAAALAAYRRATEAGLDTPRLHYEMARSQLALGRRDSALASIEAAAALGGLPAAMLRTTPEFAALAGDPRYDAAVTALDRCADANHHAFDFWVGEWDVDARGSTQPPARSSVTSGLDHCSVVERYSAPGGYSGMSINFYDAVAGRWHQTWIANAGGAVYLEGGLDADGAMVLTDADLPVSAATGTINRVTWTPHPDGTVTQFWQTSTDGGASWSVSFNGLYSRRAGD